MNNGYDEPMNEFVEPEDHSDFRADAEMKAMIQRENAEYYVSMINEYTNLLKDLCEKMADKDYSAEYLFNHFMNK